jgi:hypothetical protein
MLKKALSFKAVLIILLALSLCCPGTFARAEDRGHNRNDNRDYQRTSSSDRYHYRDGRWYREGWFGWEFLVSALAIGALIEALPPNHTTVVVAGTPYYYAENHYYRQAPNGGYVVVEPPALVQPPVQMEDTVTINVPRVRGGYTAVVLRRAGYGFIGPQGEYYANSPTVDQLQALYGNQ